MTAPKSLAEPSLPAIAHHCIANASGYRNAQSHGRFIRVDAGVQRWARIEHKQTVCCTATKLKHTRKIGWTAEPSATRKTLIQFSYHRNSARELSVAFSVASDSLTASAALAASSSRAMVVLSAD